MFQNLRVEKVEVLAVREKQELWRQSFSQGWVLRALRASSVSSRPYVYSALGTEKRNESEDHVLIRGCANLEAVLTFARSGQKNNLNNI
jgi:hypothetical protein